MNILGINAYHGDVAAALIVDGRMVAAVEEERFRRIKHWAGFPSEAIAACLRMAGITADQIDHFAISRDPKANLYRKVLFALRKRPSLKLVTDRFRNSSRVADVSETLATTLGLDPGDVSRRTHWVEHHPAHLASTFFVSPFEEAAVCAIDGFGDFVSTSLAIGRGSKLNVLEKTYFPHSLGLMYLAITQYLGFWNYGDEFKVMGLAPYGKPDCVKEIRQLLRLKRDGEFELDLSYFRHWSDGVEMTWDEGVPTLGQVYTDKLETLLGPARKREEPVGCRHEGIAASLQAVFEEAAFHILNAAYKKTRIDRLCLAGGCAMNSVMNGKIRTQTPFKEVYVQSAAGDNGTALGAAFYTWNHILERPRGFVMEHSYWGPEFGSAEVEQAMAERSDELSKTCRIRTIENQGELCDWTSAQIADGKVVGWFQGRMEWGARALGNRSIIADPRRSDMREIINTKIKFREKFRPFAPSIIEDFVDEYFEQAVPDPFMLQVYPVRAEKRSVIPAVTHVDGSGRLQTVSERTNPLYWALLKAFERRTHVPVLLNTSFNENEPIVHKPAEALDCFLRTRMDVLVLTDRIIEKIAN